MACLLLLLVGAYRLGSCNRDIVWVPSGERNAGRHRIVWQCNLARRSDEIAWWVDYREADNRRIEDAWEQCQEWVILMDDWDEPRWHVSFVRMMQITRKEDPEPEDVDVVRPIRRVLVTHE